MNKDVGRTELLSCRNVLWILVFCGFGINYMLRINLSLTIVGMVPPPQTPAASVECRNQENSVHKWTIEPQNNTDTTHMAHSTSRILALDEKLYEDRFLWTEEEQGMVLGAYYLLHWTTQVPGGLMAKRWGTKLVFGLGNFLTAVLGLLIPYAAYYHLNLLVLIRVLQGILAGVVWPSMHDMTAKWIPPNERSHFVSAYLGSSVGAAITFPLCGYTTEWFGWESSYYVTSLIGVAWYGFWAFLVHDSPQEHPRITEAEKKYILDELAGCVDDDNQKIPWKKILLSGPVWITVIAHWGGCWSFLTLLTQIPTYFTNIHGMDMTTIALLSGSPHLFRMIFSYFYSVMSDWLLRTKRMSLLNIRKLATFVAIGLQGITVLALAMSGCHTVLAVIFMMMGVVLNGAISASTLAILVDLSPNYASVLLGICGLIGITASVISASVVGILTQNNSTVRQWQKVYIVTAIPPLVSCLAFIIWGTSDQQPWNNYGTPIDQKEQEMKILSAKPLMRQDNIDEKGGNEKIFIRETEN